MSIREARLKINDTEFRQWQAFNKISPIGNDRFDILNAQLCQLLVNINCSKSKMKLDDFIPNWSGHVEKQTGADMEKMMMEAFGK